LKNAKSKLNPDIEVGQKNSITESELEIFIFPLIQIMAQLLISKKN